ncbi:MAG: peptidyl-prolyl cis-trans isomerase [Armatimonadetes bacterium]|nr:peptidyl-prolyl cis-trans isomerase [Armatimonadota bacterium]
MQPFRRGAALLAALSTLALAGCHRSATDNSGPLVLNGSSPIATVNGQDITQQQFFTQLQNYVPAPAAPAQAAGPAVLRQMISALLVEQYAKDQGVAPTDAEVNALYNTFQAVQEAQSVKPFDQLLAESGQTDQDIKDARLRPQIAQIKLLAKGQPPVTDADVSAYYAQNKAQYTEPNRAHIKRIVLASSADAKRIADQIQKGQPFDSFAAQSLDRSFPGGDVPVWVNLDAPNPQIVPPALVQLIKNAKPNGVVGPYPFHGVYWVVQVVEKKQKTVVPLDQVKDAIRFEIMTQRARQDPMRVQTVNQQLRDYQTKAKITIPEKRYAQLLDELTAPPPPTPTLTLPPASAPPAPKRGG